MTVRLRTNYLRMYWTDIHQVFTIGKHTCGDDRFFSNRTRDVAMITKFRSESANQRNFIFRLAFRYIY